MSDDALHRFRLDYAPLLLRYLAQHEESVLNLAYELGRDAMRDSLSLLDVVRVHEELSLDVVATTKDVTEAHAVGRAASDLLMDLIASFEMLQRGLMETRASETVRQETAVADRSHDSSSPPSG